MSISKTSTPNGRKNAAVRLTLSWNKSRGKAGRIFVKMIVSRHFHPRRVARVWLSRALASSSILAVAQPIRVKTYLLTTRTALTLISCGRILFRRIPLSSLGRSIQKSLFLTLMTVVAQKSHLATMTILMSTRSKSMRSRMINQTSPCKKRLPN